ncbi:hypothetical protein [Sphingomonas aerophila]|uniref:DUF2946 domain-containing protein n=1 Tax=Sphingomonas aerophila TaxID=1344948 RepID=A0A7W9BCY8_9SPHN|nr:hypothetical protein [Sphingomonas aerophila]MBB5714969.1 hypothetical protein [Sphingomonas aerophila]
MPRALPSFDLRRILLALLALGLVLRMGAGCDAMAAPLKPAAQQSHCTDMPAKPDKPLKMDAAACALCVTLPGATPASYGVAVPAAGASDPSRPLLLAGLAGGPAPPPPRAA